MPPKWQTKGDFSFKNTLKMPLKTKHDFENQSFWVSDLRPTPPETQKL
jgi:hypothetical protein